MTRYGIDAPTLLRLVEEELPLDPAHRRGRLAPLDDLLRS